MSKTSEIIRAKFKEADDLRDAGLTSPKDIIRFDNLIYGDDPKWQVLDVYRPKAAEKRRLPVIVSIHGGAWVYGDKERYQYYCMSLAQRGFAVVNFTYRLAPEFKFPASIEDTSLVFAWVLKNKDIYFFDTNYVFGVGDSAGALNLALFSAICTNPEYAKQYKFHHPDGFAPRAIALNCGQYSIHLDNTDELTVKLMEELMPFGGTKEEMEKINVLNHITSRFPAVFVMTAVDDFLRYQSPLLIQKLMECQVPFIYRFYGDAKKRLSHVFHCNIKSEDAMQCNDEECEFFRRMMQSVKKKN